MLLAVGTGARLFISLMLLDCLWQRQVAESARHCLLLPFFLFSVVLEHVAPALHQSECARERQCVHILYFIRQCLDCTVKQN